MAQPNAPIMPVNGIGDDAYYAAAGTRMVVLFVKKSDVAFNLTVGGNFPIDQPKSMEKNWPCKPSPSSDAPCERASTRNEHLCGSPL